MIAGHLPRLARLIQNDRLFRKRIVRVHVDEAHFIYTAGVDLYGLPAKVRARLECALRGTYAFVNLICYQPGIRVH
jgi:hypothetical protein